MIRDAMYSFFLSGVVGATASHVCTGSTLGFIVLLFASIGWGTVLVLFTDTRRDWSCGVVGYCASVLLFSKSLSELHAMATKRFYGAVLGELPELVLMVILLPLLGVVVARLVQLVFKG
ncbi:hypothetical protein [Pseudomonas fluorescens group sp. PF-69]